MKKNQIIIISVVTAIVLACIAFVVMYLTTDMFKSNKDLFYKYASKIDLKDIIDLDEYSDFQNRLSTQGHGDEGAYSINFNGNGESLGESILYSGYTDPANKKSNYNISINNLEGTMLEMNYMRDNDLHGVLFKDVVSQYVAVENNNLKELAKKLGIDSEIIPNKIDSNSFNKYTDAERVKSVLKGYVDLAINEIPQSCYSKIQKQDISVGDETINASGYMIELKNSDVAKILAKIVDKARNDQELFNLINVDNEMTFEEYQAELPDTSKIENVEDEGNVVFRICVYKKGSKTLKLSAGIYSIVSDSKMEISIAKDDKTYIIKLDMNIEGQKDETSIYITKTKDTEDQKVIDVQVVPSVEKLNGIKFNVQYSRNGALNSNKVSHTFDIVLSQESVGEQISINMRFDNTVDFEKSPEAVMFTEDNHLKINDLSAKQIKNLFTNLGKILSNKLKDGMFMQIMGLNSGLIERAKEARNNWEDTSSYPVVDSASNDMQVQAKDSFNMQFSAYEGERSGAETKSMFRAIEGNNSIEYEHKVEVTGITSVDNIDSLKRYVITTETDSDGYINIINISEK